MKTVRRRRKENKTDYGTRIKLLKGGVPRAVFRKSDKYIMAQYVVSNEAQDRILMGLTSKSLLNHGWPDSLTGSLKSLPASYLTGYLFGKQIVSKKLETPVLDIGMIRNVRKSKVFAFMKGLLDAGVKIKTAEDAFPEERRIIGKEMKEDSALIISKIKSSIDKIK